MEYKLLATRYQPLSLCKFKVAGDRQVTLYTLTLFPALLPPGLLVPNVCACNIRGGRRHESGGGGGTIAVCVSTEQLGGSAWELPQQMFLIRCSEIAYEALLGKELPIEYHPPPICILFSSLLVIITLLCCLFTPFSFIPSFPLSSLLTSWYIPSM